MLSAFGRAAARQVCVAGSLSIRSAGRLGAPVIPSGYRVVAVFTRGLATAVTTKRTIRATTAAASKKAPAAKKTTKKTTTKTAKKPAAKKAVKSKAKPKAKKAAKKTTTRKPKKLTDEQKDKLKLRALKEKALLKEQPAKLPVTSWNLYLVKNLKEVLNKEPKPTFADAIRQLSAEHKALPEQEKEKLDLEAQKNKTANEINLRNWIDSHSVQEIREANVARNLLKRRKSTPIKHTLPDSRFPKGRLTAYMAYVKSRYTAQEFEGLQSQNRLSKISSEWKGFNDEQRKPYVEIEKTDHARYQKEMEAYRETIEK
ncbi:hypothetical protein F5144DRAFT_188866 [Chaetomium tenue]|uniref:Uncharacterized protein n=1 Tax=Chaetomium tenue TaxID=1854479 RepID=A0ACB7PEC0_9PEZI|nr:hypothetical protein F5144DRAFT_188866 [Chaetomium globosum]